MSNPRRVALLFLLQVDGGRHLDELSAQHEFLLLSPIDRGLARELVYGCQRQRRQLDFLIAHFSARPLPRLDPLVLWVLRLGTYQIRFLRVPEHAAVHTSVELVRKNGYASASRMVNAVLRNLIRKPPRVPLEEDVQSLAIWGSHPEWLVRRCLARWGVSKTRGWMELNNLPPQGVFWVNPRFGSRQEFLNQIREQDPECREHPELCRAIFLNPSVMLPVPSPWESGFFMDEGSQWIVHKQVPPEARSCADLCAAPGGKSFLMASDLPSGARLIVGDRSWRRLLQVRLRAVRLGLSGLESLIQCDTGSPPFFPASFDFVLLDVPCSGLGTIRSNPDIRWRIQESDLGRFQKKQMHLLRQAVSLIRPAGRIVYSTCSCEPEENEEVVEQILKEFKQQLELDHQWSSSLDDRTGDCFFRAVLRRPDTGLPGNELLP